ncbi:MAG TPA: IPT/TIG domain-containing protein [Bryobacteraceae bacterium]|nr:IPT/TIG domain-containing protein [Bryobacteraceae bacterium]
MHLRFLHRRDGPPTRCFIPGCALLALLPGLGWSQTVTIAVTPSTQYQTHKYWMVIPSTGPGPNGSGMIAAEPNWPSMKQAFISQLVNQLGVNTLQFTDQPSDIENNVDVFGLCALGPGTAPVCGSGESNLLFTSVNDDGDPNHFNCADQTLVNCPTTFPLTKNDWVIDNYWLGSTGMKAQLQAVGKTPYFILQYIHRTGNSAYLWNSAAEIAEEITAVFVHDYNKYNFVPDILDLDVEPDLHCDSSGNAPPPSVCGNVDGGRWTYGLLGAVAQTVKSRLKALGFTPEIWCCSTTFSSHAAAWYQGVKAVAGSGVITGVSTHWYDTVVGNLRGVQLAAAADGLPAIMTEWEAMSISDEFALEMNLQPAGTMRYSDIGPQSTNWLTLLNTNPYTAQYVDGTETSDGRGPAWFFPQFWGYVPDGSVQEAVVSSNQAYTAVAFVRPDGTHAVSLISTVSNASPSVRVTGLPAGTYGCTYTLGDARSDFLLSCGANQTISAGGALNFTVTGVKGAIKGSTTVTATFFGISNPAVAVSGIANATGASSSIEAGSWVAIYGTNLSTTTRSWRASDFPANGTGLPTELDGVSVTFGGQNAAVYYISPTQINVQATDVGSGTVPVMVANASGTAKGSATFLPAAPGFFPQGSYAAAVHLDGTYVAPVGYFGSGVASRPAQPGETIELFGTGFGPTTPAVPAGSLVTAPAPLSSPVQPNVLIGGASASVLWTGIVVPGEYQLNLVVPNVPDGDQTIVASVGNALTQAGLLIPVKR